MFDGIKILQERKRKYIIPTEWTKIRNTFPLQSFALGEHAIMRLQ